MADTSKPKKKVTDYAGIAALVTAIAGLATVLASQNHYEEKAALVQDGVLVVLQYRIGELEKMVGKQAEELVELRIEVAKRPGSTIPATAPKPPATRPAADPPPEAPPAPLKASTGVLDTLVQRVRAKEAVRVIDLQELVQHTGKALAPADLED